jgi:DivIVA domain-containing protein
MGQFLLLVVVALTVGAVVFGVTVLLTGGDRGLSSAEPDGQAVPLPGTRPLVESDIAQVRFDTGLRGYRMDQVDQAMRRAAYDVGYKDELINVLEAEVDALRSGRFSDAEVLRRAREAAQAGTSTDADASTLTPGEPAGDKEVAVIDLTEEIGASVEEPEREPAEAAVTDEPEREPAGAAVTDEPEREPAEADDTDEPEQDAAAAEPAVARPEEPAADDTGEPATAGAAEPAVASAAEPAADGAEERAARDADKNDAEEPVAQADTGGDAGNGSDAPESDSVLPSRR